MQTMARHRERGGGLPLLHQVTRGREGKGGGGGRREEGEGGGRREREEGGGRREREEGGGRG